MAKCHVELAMELRHSSVSVVSALRSLQGGVGTTHVGMDLKRHLRGWTCKRLIVQKRQARATKRSRLNLTRRRWRPNPSPSCQPSQTSIRVRTIQANIMIIQPVNKVRFLALIKGPSEWSKRRIVAVELKLIFFDLRRHGRTSEVTFDSLLETGPVTSNRSKPHATSWQVPSFREDGI